MTALQRYEPAQQILDAHREGRTRQRPRLVQPRAARLRTLGESDAALAAFTRATELAPADAYAHYFVGLHQPASCSSTTRRSRRSRARSNSIRSSSRPSSASPAPYQRSGKTDDAKTHMDRFTRLTQEKVASAMSLSYGDQGPLSLAQAVQPLAGAAAAAIPVKFVAPPLDGCPAAARQAAAAGLCLHRRRRRWRHRLRPARTTSGAIVMRNDGKGQFAPGAALRRHAGGSTARSATTTTTRSRTSRSRPQSGVSLFRNTGAARSTHGGAAVDPEEWSRQRVALGVSFVDFDHDADLDLVVARAPAARGRCRRAPAGDAAQQRRRHVCRRHDRARPRHR